MENNKNSYSRRKFLETTAFTGIVGALGFGSALFSCSKKKSYKELGLPPLLDHAPDGQKLKAGLIGTGNRGTGAAFNFLGAGPNLEVTALADVFQERIDACRDRFKKYNIEIPEENCFVGFDAYQKLLETDVDVVILATPPHFRPEHFKEAIQHKKHVFMEKPLAVDPVGIRSILSTAKRAESLGLCVVTGTQRRHQQDYIETYKQIANGAIGEIVAAKAYWNQSHVWFRTRREGWSDMEYMLRNWNNFIWLSGDHILDTHVHNIDVINWFTGKHPKSAIGYGGRHRRVTGDQFDFFSIDFDYGNSLSSHSMCRQIDSCADGVGEVVIGTKGYSICTSNANKIYNFNDSVMWEYEYEKSENDPLKQEANSAYIQEHIHLVTAIRTNEYVNEAEKTAFSTLTAIMGREAAYTGKRITWDEIMNSDQRLGPSEYKMGPVNMKFEVPVAGTPINV
jgi:myo-inositol 2-dehydrogenase/D-chiro-inositol 1-dehydrogenase